MIAINPLSTISTATNISGSNKTGGEDFSNLLKNAIKGTVNAQRESENLTLQAATGKDVPMHEVIQAIGKAEMTLQTMLTVRDKTITAYQEILRMPI